MLQYNFIVVVTLISYIFLLNNTEKNRDVMISSGGM